MKLLALVCILLCVTGSQGRVPLSYWQEIKLTDNGGGIQCAACTIVMTLLQNLAEVNEKSVEQILDEICDYFPNEVRSTCQYFVNTYGDLVVALFAKGLSADQVCQSLAVCTDPTCTIHQQKSENPTLPPIVRPRKEINNSPWDWLINLINTVANHKPAFDIDKDMFSIFPTLRGSNWRGKDCDDGNRNVYPGRKSDGDIYSDSNCNGIWGKDPKGNSYESLFCDNSEQRGIAVLGDSAGAHFEIPVAYFNASMITKRTFDNILDVLSMEIDLPQRSGYTAFTDSTPSVPVDSIYKRLVARNRCNHRDFQNVGVNGCRSSSLNDSVIRTFARNPQKDNPVLVFLELIGNDVCHPAHSLNSMSTPAEFKTNILASLKFLNETLPKGSHVVFVGLADGLVLWDSLHDRLHPLGMTYAQVYDYLNCLGISPCWAWMNSNATVRAAGQARANQLSAVYTEIMKEYKFPNFDMAYYDFPFEGIVNMWKKKGGQVWQLIEPCDGFHPNQIANALMAEWFWNTLSKDHPDFLGPVNPHNQAIQQIFGNQGGY